MTDRRLALLGVLGIVSAGVVSVGGTAAEAALPANCVQTSGTVTCTFSFTGAAQSWLAPAGVSSAVFEVYGAQGGGAQDGPSSFNDAGGKGGKAVATVGVTPGATYLVYVGGQGEVGRDPAPGAAGGFNGGGPGGVSPGNGGGGGGGASDVRTASGRLVDRLVVAGGGGGGDAFDVAFGVGGAGGGLTGGDGSDQLDFGTPNSLNCGGKGGTQTAGGAAGTGLLPALNGSPGTFGSGGAGASASDFSAGGGGGGYYGGGGASAAQPDVPVPCDGGGGSGFGPAGVVFESGVRAGNGLVVISYSVPTAASLLDALQPKVVGVGPGSALADKLEAAETALAAGNNSLAKRNLNEFIRLVRAQSGKKIAKATADALIADAQQVLALIS